MGCCGRSGPVRPPGPKPPPALNVASAQEMARKQFKEAGDAYTVERRIQACQTCPYRQDQVCNRCGCFLVAKVGQKHERCPLNKW